MESSSASGLTWGSRFVTALNALPEGATAVALVRHAERGPIPDFRDNERVALTRRGEADAYRLGRHIAPGRLLRGYHSTVGRCRVTVTRIAEGYRAAGGEAQVLGSIPSFASPYVVDTDAVADYCSELNSGFVRAWLDGEIPVSAILPPREAARRQWCAIQEVAGEAPAGSLTLVCTHDWNIMLLRETYLGARHEDVGWAEYLDGPVILAGDGECRLVWQDHAASIPHRAASPHPGLPA